MGVGRAELLLRIESSTTPRRYLVIGEVDMSSVDQLSEFLAARSAEGEPVTLDLSGTTFLDSSGIHVLVAGSRLFAEVAPLQLVNLSVPVRRVLDVALPDGLPTLIIERA
jgi:anti-anti-sigma factor